MAGGAHMVICVHECAVGGFVDLTCVPLPPLLNSLDLGCFGPNNFSEALRAYGDSTTDDTLAIQNHIYCTWELPSESPSQPAPRWRMGGTVYFPPSPYIRGQVNSHCNAPLFVPANVSLVRTNAGGAIPPQAEIGVIPSQPNEIFQHPNAAPKRSKSAQSSLRVSGPESTVHPQRPDPAICQPGR